MNDKAVEAARCKQTVARGDWDYGHCLRRAAKDGYCKQHHPGALKKRARKRAEEREAQAARRVEADAALRRFHNEQFIDGLTDGQIHDLSDYPVAFRLQLKGLASK